MNELKTASPAKPRPGNRRSVARLAVVQALYQMDLAGTDLTDIIAEFTAHRLGETVDGDDLAPADGAFFADLLRGVVSHQRVLDPLINTHLATGWHLSRIDSTLRAILRAASYELAHRSDVPPRVVINEYIDLAHAFFDGDEPKVVNGILDRIAKEQRADDAPAAPVHDEQP